MTTVYRLRNSDGDLLYVGMTEDLDRRLAQHSIRTWWPEVDRVDKREYESRKTAAEAEQKAIANEHPRYNQQAIAAEVRERRRIARREAYIPWTERAGVTIAEAAQILSTTEKALYHQIKRGQTPTFSIGGRQLVPVAWLIEKRNTTAAA